MRRAIAAADASLRCQVAGSDGRANNIGSSSGAPPNGSIGNSSSAAQGGGGGSSWLERMAAADAALRAAVDCNDRQLFGGGRATVAGAAADPAQPGGSSLS